MSKALKITYWTSTILLAFMMCMSAAFYLFQQDMIVEAYTALGFPVYLMFFNGAVKVLGAVAIVAPRFNILKEWAYAGFTYLLVLAVLAHLMVGDGEWMGAAIGLVLLMISYISYKKLKK